MRLATLNVFGLSGNWSDRLVVLRNGFLALDADLVTLQETMVRAEVDQAAEILGPGFHLAHASHREANGSGITTATKWPAGRVVEVDLHVTERTHEFACTCLVTEILAPQPYGRIWLANYLPDYQVDHERERRLQAVTLARALDGFAAEQAGHVIVAGDMDADEAADSIRFWTGRHVIDDLSVCYRSAWESARPTERLVTFAADIRSRPTGIGLIAVFITCSYGVRHTGAQHCRYWTANESSTSPRYQATTTDSSSNSTHHHAGPYQLSTRIRSANAPAVPSPLGGVGRLRCPANN